MNKRTLAIAAAIGASGIYGINHSIAKGVMPNYIGPFGFILLRVLGASILFWLLSLFLPKEKIASKDWPRIISCAIFGMVINMLLFFKGLSLSTPINSSVIITISPIFVLLLSSFLQKQAVKSIKVLGILLGLCGAVALTLFGATKSVNAPNIPLGNTLFIGNAMAYGVYLILVKPLTKKYSVVTLMKWIFLAAFLINLPITYQEFAAVQWQKLPLDVIFKMSFVVIGTTFCTYLLNIFALKELSPATISAFIYLQPLIAIVFAVSIGVDSLTLPKVIAAITVFLGVYLVTKKNKN